MLLVRLVLVVFMELLNEAVNAFLFRDMEEFCDEKLMAVILDGVGKLLDDADDVDVFIIAAAAELFTKLPFIVIFC